jgi:uncharacterized protein (DUF2236 family)
MMRPLAEPGVSTVPHAPTIGWKLQREIVLLLAWGPAILLQVAHPLIAQGIADHSRFRAQPWGRVRRFHGTLDAMLGLCFGTEPERRAVLARINAIHDRVHGTLPLAAGGFPTGTSYSAHDPALLTWVHATLLDMNVRVYERFVAPLATSERDAYCAEGTAIEAALGIPVGSLPRTDAELQRYMNGMLGSGQLAITDAARALARDVVHAGGSLVGRSAMWWPRLITLGLLPSTIRAAYGFPWDSRRERLFGWSTTLVRRLLPLVPGALRYWPASHLLSRGR